MRDRPYFNTSIKNLEEIFQSNRNDKEICQDILHELGFRSTARASKLKSQMTMTNESEMLSAKAQSRAKQKAAEARTPPPSISDLFEPNVGPTETIPEPKRTPGPKPPIANYPQDILRAWTALEVLSPQGIVERLISQAGTAPGSHDWMRVTYRGRSAKDHVRRKDCSMS